MTLSSLLNRRDLWLGRDAGRASDGVLDSGFAELNRALHYGGWPEAGLCELLCQPPCPLTLRLLLPALARLEQGGILLAAPPARPSARALLEAGLDLQRVLVLRGRQPASILRACREAAASQAFAALVLWWPANADPRDLRRLQLAARQGRCWLTLIRPHHDAGQASPAALRLRLRVCPPGDLQLEILKQPGGWAGQSLLLPLLPGYLREPLPHSASMPVPGFMDHKTAEASSPEAQAAPARASQNQYRKTPADIAYRLGNPGDTLPSPPLSSIPLHWPASGSENRTEPETPPVSLAAKSVPVKAKSRAGKTRRRTRPQQRPQQSLPLE